MPIYDHLCKCGKITEAICSVDDTRIKCACGKTARRIISMSGVHCGNDDDTSWARYGIEVMPKDSPHIETREFLKNPTKKNYRRAMKAEGVRFMEPGEKAIDRSKQRPNVRSDDLLRLLHEDRRIEVHG